MSEAELVLVRHGESIWNTEPRHQGQAGPGLSELGKRQADHVAAILRERYPTVTYAVASDLPRTMETARPWVEAYGVDVVRDPRWREVDIGAWAGLRPDDAATRFPEERRAFTQGIDIARGGGETFAEMSRRVWEGIRDCARVTAELPGPAIVFTHGGPIQVAAARALGIEPIKGQWLRSPHNASLTVLRVRLPAAGRPGSVELTEYAVPTWNNDGEPAPRVDARSYARSVRPL